MELVGELPASHHLASRPARVVGDVGMYGKVGRGWMERCTTDEAPPGPRADSSPPKHFSSHQSRHAGREACSSSSGGGGSSGSLHCVSFFLPLSCSVLARPWPAVPSSHTPAGRTWCPASSIIPKVNRFNKDYSFVCSLSCGSGSF